MLQLFTNLINGNIFVAVIFATTLVAILKPILMIGLGSFRFVLGKKRWELILESDSNWVWFWVTLGFILVSIPLFVAYVYVGLNLADYANDLLIYR